MEAVYRVKNEFILQINLETGVNFDNEQAESQVDEKSLNPFKLINPLILKIMVHPNKILHSLDGNGNSHQVISDRDQVKLLTQLLKTSFSQAKLFLLSHNFTLNRRTNVF